VLWTWTYPSVTEQQKSLVLRKCCLDGDHVAVQPFVYGRSGKAWYYIICTEVFDSDKLPRASINVHIITKFNTVVNTAGWYLSGAT
jgi:hypothetical protein